MLRIIAGIIVGWIVMSCVVIATFGITIAAMGGFDKVLKPNSYWTTDTFNIIVLAGGFIGAIVGGIVCKTIARNFKATFALVGIVLAFGIGSAIMNMNKPDPPPRTGPATFKDISKHGKEPNWFAYMKVALAAAGLIIGSSLVSKKSTPI